ncbi:uncharacterized protein LOC123718347 [Pieris brassicae]|uniref:uncharacterized protein LOC123718347 n=1 Tax=Pieris brassicae TaxID=7116 RepID=UPI001E6609FA|nr:uncharacterized protein LOC123718347 [Pieris brassicae]
MNEAPVTLTESNSSKNIPDEGESISVFAKDLDTRTSSSKENKDKGSRYQAIKLLKKKKQYLSSTDEIIGFESLKGTNLANHAVVFMIKGVRRNFNQPVAYFFTQSLKKIDLKTIIKDVISHVETTGLKVLATVCDQGATNVSAINSLIQDTRAEYCKKGVEWRRNVYQVGHQKIYHIYDVPHLFKGLRNNLLNKDLIYKDPKDHSEKTVKWDYFRILYEADRSFGELSCSQSLCCKKRSSRGVSAAGTTCHVIGQII